MESKDNRDLKRVQDQKLAENPHAIRPKEDLEIVRKAVYVLEQHLEIKGRPRFLEVSQILDCLTKFSDQKYAEDKGNRDNLRTLLLKLLKKEKVNDINKALFDQVYNLLFIWTKYWPKNQKDGKGEYKCCLNIGESIQEEGDRFVFPLLGYQYKATDKFFGMMLSTENSTYVILVSEEDGCLSKLLPRDIDHLKKEAIRRGVPVPSDQAISLPRAPVDDITIREQLAVVMMYLLAVVGFLAPFFLVALGYIHVSTSLIRLALTLSNFAGFTIGSVVGWLVGYGLGLVLEGASNLVSRLIDGYNQSSLKNPNDNFQADFQLKTHLSERLLTHLLSSPESKSDPVPEMKNDNTVKLEAQGNQVEFKPAQSPLAANTIMATPSASTKEAPVTSAKLTLTV